MTTSALEQLIPAGTWHVDPTHSQIDFSVRHLGISTVRGTFSGVTATLEGGDAPTLTGSIDLTTVSTRDEQRDAHLASPDFFDVDRYPEATFTATFIAPDRVVGELRLKGVTREIELAATYTQPTDDPYGNERIGIDLEGEINRSDFGVSFNFPLPTGGLALAANVKLLASLSFVKEA